VQRIDELCLPTSFLYHELRGSDPARWQGFLPDFGHYFNAVKSVSTLQAQSGPASFYGRPLNSTKLLLTQSVEIPEERFLSDNFGVAHDLTAYTNPIPGLFETLCYVGPGQPGFKAGTKEVHTVQECLSDISSGSVSTFANLASAHTNGLRRIEPRSWSSNFLLFVGESCKDRVNFWNSRLLTPSWIGTPGSLLIGKSKVADGTFLRELGNYLNKVNFQRTSGGPAGVELRSFTETAEVLQEIQSSLRRVTHNQVLLNRSNYNVLACPASDDYAQAYFRRSSPLTLKFTESSSEVDAEPPAHFEFNPASFSFLNSGVWAIDLAIERHNNLSKYSNVTDIWQLPRKSSACLAFTNSLSKISFDNLLTIIPTVSGHNGGRKRAYDLGLPSDSDFFHSLVVGRSTGDQRDLRFGMIKARYVDLALSDKGQNLRGVISMFPRFGVAYGLLTNKLWREAIRKFGRDPSVTKDRIHGLIPNDGKFKEDLAKKLRIDKCDVHKFIHAALADSLEYLVERSALFQIHRWRCDYCGHANFKSIDDLKKENDCSVCRTKYYAPIDVSWEFKFNTFVSDSLVSRNGLSVLWALGFLHGSMHRGSFYFLPEVDLYFEEGGLTKREEIDILCVQNGTLMAAEVKKSATSFLRKDGEISKFVTKIKALKPDTALLIFEELSENPAEAPQVKIELEQVRQQISADTRLDSNKLKAIVASESREFREYGEDFGWCGERTEKFLYTQ
jgi:hypothetical protein